MIVFRRFLPLLLLLGACETGPKSSGLVDAEPELVRAEIDQATSAQNNRFALTGLASSLLPGGTCGMVLWTLDANRPVPVLRYVAGKAGEFRINGVPHELIQVDSSGQSEFGVSSDQRYAAGKDITVNVEIVFGQGFDGGTYIERGVIRVDKPDLGTLVTPVAGLAGCRS